MTEPAERLTYEAYLELERTSARKHEFINGRVFAMAGGTVEHARLQMALGRALGNALDGQPCAVFSSDLRVRIEATGRATYPDVTVVCNEREVASDDPDAIVNPTLIAEVLSKTTEAEDRGDKFAHYRRLQSLQEYLLVSETEPRVDVFRREGSKWSFEEYSGDADIPLLSLGVTISLSTIYRDPLS